MATVPASRPCRPFDVIAFDPPYVAKDSGSGSSMEDFDDRYGLGGHASGKALHDDNMVGLAELARVLAPKGRILAKCMDYTDGREFLPITYWTVRTALEELGLQIIDRFEHVGLERQYQRGDGQDHARRNLSTLLVFCTTKWWRKR